MVKAFKILLILPMAFCLLTCNKTSPNASDKKDVSPLTIDLQPFDDIPPEQVKFVYYELKKFYARVECKAPIQMPQAAYYEKRKRYRADTLIKFLKGLTSEGHVTVGMTGCDISHNKGKIQDYGIMGLGFQPGSSCVVSTFRLLKAKRSEQFFKLTLHEIGHTQGLPHCPEKTCFMRDAEGKNHTEEETVFCDACKKVLMLKGWTFEH